MRITVARKIALALVGVVVLSVGAMVWISSQNLQRGFLNYLQQSQVQDLEALRDLLAGRYRERGDFEWLRNNPEALREFGGQRLPRPAAGDPPPLAGYGRPPPRNDGRRPPPPPRRDGGGPPDPYGFGRRLSVYDAAGRPVFGPPEPPPGTARDIVVDGRVVGSVHLTPLAQVAGASDQAFLREQIRDMLWAALALALFSGALALWLARQLLRPVAALRLVAERIATGHLDARAPVSGRDELAELAQHVNRMAQALEQNERQRRRMLADVSHELRTPLTVIRGEIEALLDGIRRADPAALASLHDEVLRLNKLIDDLHQLALADAGDLDYRYTTVDLGELLHDVLERYRARIEGCGLSLSLSLPAKTIAVPADADRLTQVIVNLLENSLRYTDAGGCIAVGLTHAGAQALLCIEDSAPGVPDGTHAHLFERLYRADKARSRHRGGSGLGLSICKALVHAHRGSIEALPSALGGVKIVITLPLAVAGEDHT